MASYLPSLTLQITVRQTELSNAVRTPWRPKHTHLRGEHEGLHEPAHGLHVVGELPHHLHHHPVVEGGVGVHMTDLRVAILEV